MNGATFLEELTVVELGQRAAAGRCGTLMAELGATVYIIEEPQQASGRRQKWHDRSQVTAGKLSIVFDSHREDDKALLCTLLQRADVVITSSDADSAQWDMLLDDPSNSFIRCDISAFGRSGPLSGRALPDGLMQAHTGSMWVTGMSDGPPTLSRCNYIDGLGSAFAVSGILAALEVRRTHRYVQEVEIGLFDCATAVNTTFLSQYLAGGDPGRIGNRHVSMAPWNSYQTQDGWVVLCTGSNDQWSRVCETIGQPSLKTDSRFDTPQKRVEHWKAVDNIIETWSRTQMTDDCMALLSAHNLPCGPVYQKEDLFLDTSLQQREMVITTIDPITSKPVQIAGSPFRGDKAQRVSTTHVPIPDSGRSHARALMSCHRPRPLSSGKPDPDKLPLAGLRVIEIGTYTTAPLTARQLGALGADVIKLEPPAGDPGRRLPPLQFDQSVFFSLGNSDKRSVVLDLKTSKGLDTFRDLLRTADVLVENLRPGSLRQLGLSPEALHALNPRLVYCSITGFGVVSPYATRTAMDTTVQAMSGIMDLTRPAADQPPCKIGLSICDAMGGAVALANILAALEFRHRHGTGQWIDLSMQDIAATLTQHSWNNPVSLPTVVHCSDKQAVLDAEQEDACAAITELVLEKDGRVTFTGACTDLLMLAERAGLFASPVNSIAEAMSSPQAVARGFFIETSENQRGWTLLNPPIRLSHTPARVRRAIGPTGHDTKETINEWLAVAV